MRMLDVNVCFEVITRRRRESFRDNEDEGEPVWPVGQERPRGRILGIFDRLVELDETMKSLCLTR